MTWSAFLVKLFPLLISQHRFSWQWNINVIYVFQHNFLVNFASKMCMLTFKFECQLDVDIKIDLMYCMLKSLQSKLFGLI